MPVTSQPLVLTLQSIRGDDRPWGGVQMIVCGDFFQLPPIEKAFHPSFPANTFYNRGFTFQCPVWRSSGLHSCLLTKVPSQTHL